MQALSITTSVNMINWWSLISFGDGHHCKNPRFIQRTQTDKILKLEVGLWTALEIFTTISTNYFRELTYNIEHAIHHMAIMKIGVREVAPYVTLPTILVLPLAPCVIKRLLSRRWRDDVFQRIYRSTFNQTAPLEYWPFGILVSAFLFYWLGFHWKHVRCFSLRHPIRVFIPVACWANRKRCVGLGSPIRTSRKQFW